MRPRCQSDHKNVTWPQGDLNTSVIVITDDQLHKRSVILHECGCFQSLPASRRYRVKFFLRSVETGRQVKSSMMDIQSHEKSAEMKFFLPSLLLWSSIYLAPEDLAGFVAAASISARAYSVEELVLRTISLWKPTDNSGACILFDCIMGD